MSVSDLLAQQSAGLQQVADLKKQAMQNYGVEQGLFNGAKTAYATGKKQISELIGQERSQKLEAIIPPAAVAGKFIFKKYGLDEKVASAKKAIGEGLESAKNTVGEGLESAGNKLSDAADSAGDAISSAAKAAGQKITQAFSSSTPDTVVARATGTAEEDEFPEAQGATTGDLAQGTGSTAARSTASAAGDGGGAAATPTAAPTAGGGGGAAAAPTAEEAAATESSAADFMASIEQSGAKVAARVAETAAEKGAAVEAGESAIPGFGEIAMAFTALGMLIHGIHKEHKEELQEKAANIAPKAPGAPNLPTVNFDSAPVIDSSAFHAL